MHLCRSRAELHHPVSLLSLERLATPELQAVADPRSGTAVVIGAVDNLVKGAAGQAIQNANLALGFPEDAGLPTLAVYP